MSGWPTVRPMLTAEILKALLPRCDAATWVGPLSATMREFDISTPKRAAHFLAQLGHESVGLTRFEENLNYTAARLVEVWPKRFTAALAASYARQPERIANYVYASRYGNGDELSGDGWKYRGRGPIQLTFKDNYWTAGAALGLDLDGDPDQVKDDPMVGARVAGWYWDSRKLNALADADDCKGCTLKINGGLNGLHERISLTERAMRLLS